ncbi:MAG: amidohydrolase [Lachnospiraceae bacterium]|nr:amidohydrolase [Lachnospiraceae bacterium]
MFKLNWLQHELPELQKELFEIYKDLHQHPEPGFEEVRTSGIIAEYLKKLGLCVQTGLAFTGVVGLLDSGRPGKTLMLRADMDCLAIPDQSGLPYQSEHAGYCHACGHDSHVTMLLGAAAVLSRHKEKFQGKIKFVFQPCEEGTLKPEVTQALKEAGYVGRPGEAGLGGAGFLIKEGVLEGVDACIGLHVQPELPLGAVSLCEKEACASTDKFTITFQGRGGHGSTPHKVIDPVPAIAELIQAIHMLPTREANAAETTIFHIGNISTPGSLWSAVADKAIIEGGYRTYNEETRRLFGKRVPELAQHIAQAWRCEMTYDHVTGYAPTINDPTLSAQVAKNCRQLLGEEKVRYTNQPMLTAEDFSEYARLVPSVLVWLGCAVGPNPPALHHPSFHVDERVLPVGIQVHVGNALAYLNGAL